MKVNKKQLRRIIREELSLLNEHRYGAGSIGFASWKPNERPNFAKSYGSEAKVVWDHSRRERPNVSEQGMPAMSDDPAENAFQTLKYNGAFKDLQEIMHDATSKIDTWQQEHEVGLEDADMVDVGVQLEDARLALDALRQLANQFR